MRFRRIWAFASFSILFLFLCTAACGEGLYTREWGLPKAPQLGSAAESAGCYNISKRYPLTKSHHGFDGTLQLLQDSRLSEFSRDGEPVSAFDLLYDEEVRRLFKDAPPLGAVLRIVTSDGEMAEVEESRTFDNTPIACLKEVSLKGPDKPSYFLTCDGNTGIGAHSGTVTYPYEVANRKLRSNYLSCFIGYLCWVGAGPIATYRRGAYQDWRYCRNGEEGICDNYRTGG